MAERPRPTVLTHKERPVAVFRTKTKPEPAPAIHSLLGKDVLFKGEIHTNSHSFRVEGAVELGQYRLAAGVHFSDIRPGNELPSGNLGGVVLRGFQVTLDSKYRRILFEQPAAN